MENEPLIISLNNYSNNEYKFALKSAVLSSSADFCVIEILYKDGLVLSKEKKAEFTKYLLDMLPKKYNYEIKFIKNFISEDRITDDFKVFMKNTFPSISYKLEKVELANSIFYINLKIDNLSIPHAKEKHFEFLTENYFKNLYEDYDFKCSYIADDVYVEDKEEILKQNYTEEDVDMSALRKIEVTDKICIVGEEIEESASYAMDQTSAADNVIVCGKISSIKAIVIKRKQKKQAEETQDELKDDKEDKQIDDVVEEENAEENTNAIKYERKLYKWALQDFTGSVNCVFFSNKENQSKLEKLDTDSVIIVRGKLENDNYTNGLVLSVKDISYCTIPENLEEVIVYHKEKPFYEYVKPEKIITYKQNDLMNFAVEEVVPIHLKDKTFVCYDFETTGLHYEAGDKIIEIGAVKIENGKITEKFMSYVNPERKIPAESSAISGIVDDDVKDAPIDSMVLQDFYKFTRNSIIIGYNILNFDNAFLLGQGKKSRWNFDNEFEDVYKLAQKYVKGVKNYKLGTIASHLGVTLDNAHRAVYDALATAEVFIKIAEQIKD